MKNNPTIDDKFILTLTTDHASSSYGIPVLVDADGQAYGPDDEIATGETGREFVLRYQRGGGRLSQRDPESAPQFVEGLKIAPHEGDDVFDLISATDPEKKFLEHEPA